MNSESNASPNWFSGLSIYHVTDESPPVYEERIVVVWASAFHDADKQLKAEALQYEKDHAGHKLLAFRLIYNTQEETLESGAEVWSVLKEAELPPDEYLRQYHGNDFEGFLVKKAEQAHER